MGEHVTVEYGHHVWIDAQAWVDQRVGQEHTELTAALRDWGRRAIVTWAYQNWITRVELWCQARDYRICEGFPLMHEERLSRDVFVLLAVAGDRGPVAIVWIDEDPPTVHADLTTDPGSWSRVGSVDIVCPCGRRWTWRDDNQLVTADGDPMPVAAVFGNQPNTPIIRCPACVAGTNDATNTRCPCPGADVTTCPECGQRCDLQLTAVPTVPRRRPHAVHVSKAVEYHGWVLATDPDDADDDACRLLDDGHQCTSVGYLEVVRLDREVMANDAAEVCWQCRTDPRQPNPACPHPSPGSTGRGVAKTTRPALACDTATVEAWLRAPSSEHPGSSNAEALGVDEECFGRGLCGFLRTVEDVMMAWPAGLARRADVEDVLLWLVPDGDVLDQGAVITVDLAGGVRLASLHQDIKDFADRDAHGVAAAVSALAHIAAQVSMVVDGYRRNGGASPGWWG